MKTAPLIFLRNTFFKTAIALLVVLACCNNIQAQTYFFKNFTVENGLPQSQVLSIFQDASGRLWIGTNQGGVALYDGKGFEYITVTEGLANNVVYNITQSKKGLFYIGTHGGLSVYDGKKIKNYTTENGLSYNGVTKIFEDKKGKIWLGTGVGICFLEKDTVIKFKSNSVLDSVTVFNIVQDIEGNMWFCTVQNGLFKLSDGKLTNYSTKNGLRSNYIFSIAQPDAQTYWISTYEGLYELNNEKITRVAGTNNEIPFYDFCMDADSNLWVGSSEGVFKYKNKKLVTQFKKSNDLVDNDIWKVLQDREGNMWFASKINGLSKLNSEMFYTYTHTDGLPDDNIEAIFQDSSGLYWIGTKRGATSFDGKKYKTYKVKDGLSSEDVLCFDQDKNGNILIGTNFGLTRFSGKKFTAINADENDYNHIEDILVDDDGTIWLATWRGIARVVGNKIIPFTTEASFQNKTYTIYKDSEGILWFGFEDGVLRYNGKTLEHRNKSNGFIGDRVRCIQEDDDWNLWFGTNDGLYKYNRVHLAHLSEKEGLKSGAIYSMIFDKNNSMWLGMPKGVSRITVKNDTINRNRYFAKDDGFPGGCSNKAIIVDNKNKIWIGTSKGLVVYQPEYDKPRITESNTVIKEIRLFSQAIDWNTYADSVDSKNIPYNLVLPYDRNYITFDFVGISLTNPHEINYQHYLKGFTEKDWSSSSLSTTVQYPSLPPGEYEFLIRSGTEEEIANAKPVSFKFVIKPPFWQTWWFYLICASVVSAGIYSYIRIRRANIQITRQKEEISKQKDIIEHKNRDITDSINYAKTLQEAVLPPKEVFKKYLNDSFIIYMPKDIVSGDFYWIEKRGDLVITTVADCTGHGVPGAFMSIIGHNGLNQAVNEHRLLKPSIIMNYLNMSVNETLHKASEGISVRDGMDMALCIFNTKTLQLEYSGAHNALFIVNKGELNEIKADRMSIGQYTSEQKSFTNHTIQLEPGQSFYMFSDGIVDQFGGPNGKKFKKSQLRELLQTIGHLPMEEQKKRIVKSIQDWRGELEQVDDICIIGIKA